MTAGAAAWAPKPPWSTTTTTTYWGLGIGPNPTNHALGSWSPVVMALDDVSAVPVFPAIRNWPRLKCAYCWNAVAAVPFSTTPSRPWRIGSWTAAGNDTFPVTLATSCFTTLSFDGLTSAVPTWGW